MSNSYLESAIKQFMYYKSLGDKTFDQFSFEELQKEVVHDANSIAIIVKHLVGNMLSRWTNFLTEDGEKPWRQRDSEFIGSYKNKEELISNWNVGWTCLMDALNSLTEVDLNTIIYIRNEGHTITEAINRQLCHYSYHIGQIVFIGKLNKGKNWHSLSIPKGNSTKFNAEKFSKEKSKRHFSDDL